ncbi:MAG: 5-oxoprolinase subunit PxpB [Vicinamibacteria bacterium]
MLRVGDAAASLELGDAVLPQLSARVLATDAELRRAPFEGLLECVPSFRSLLVRFDASRVRFDAVRGGLLRALEACAAREAPAGRLHELPVRYGGEDGPDLEAVARAVGLEPAQVAALHAASVYGVFMLGFRPGFPYLGLLPERLALPRRATPRPRVPAGSVALAARQTGIYPEASPGGWHLIGRTNALLFDPLAERPALVEPGDRVRFVRVEELGPAPRRAGREPEPTGGASVEVLDGGLLTSIQDAGRSGLRRLGVGSAGAADLQALAAANAALGNAWDAAALECTLAGPGLRFLRPTRFAVAGADLGARLERDDLGAWPVPPAGAVLARPGQRLWFAGRRAGCRAVIAFAGGVRVPAVLGSRSTDRLAGFGGKDGRPLAAGDLLELDAARDTLAARAAGAFSEPPEVLTLRVVLGPQDDHFDEQALRRFLGAAFSVSATSDRVGCRLEGPPLSHAGPAEIVSDGMLEGCVQVPPDGQPIVALCDGPTTGGYPKIATVIAADLPRIAQLVPGQSRVRFEAVDLGQDRA